MCVSAATQQEQLLPFKHDSLKTLLLTMHAPSVLTNRAYYAQSLQLKMFINIHLELVVIYSHPIM